MSDLPATVAEALERRAATPFAPGEFLATPSQTTSTVWLLRAGRVRLFSLTPEGDEHVHGFPAAGEWVHGLLALPAAPDCCRLPALGVEALTPTLASAIEIHELERWRHEEVAVAMYFADRLMAYAGDRLAREVDLATRTPEQRYRALLERDPGLLEEVRLQDIARWLGITPVALSRIRRRLRVD